MCEEKKNHVVKSLMVADGGGGYKIKKKKSRENERWRPMLKVKGKLKTKYLGNVLRNHWHSVE